MTGVARWGNSKKPQQYLAVYVTKQGHQFLRSNEMTLIFNDLPKKVLDGLKIKTPSQLEGESSKPVLISAIIYQDQAILELKQLIIGLRLKEARAQGCTPFAVSMKRDVCCRIIYIKI